MAGLAKPELRLAQPSGWFDQLAALLTRELAPSSRKFRTALRLTTIGTLGAGLVASCHVNNRLGTYIVWLLVGAGPMMSARKASAFLIAEALAIASSVVMAGILVESPWLMLPFLFAVMSFSTYVGTTLKLGAALLLIQVVCFDTFYSVGTIVLFDNWLWPDRGEEILLESLGASVARDRSRLLENFASFNDSLVALTGHIERLLDEPPQPPPRRRRTVLFRDCPTLQILQLSTIQ